MILRRSPALVHMLTYSGSSIRPPWRHTKSGSYLNSGMRCTDFSDSAFGLLSVAVSTSMLIDVGVQHPGLRLQQYEELLYKKFQKSPENP